MIERENILGRIREALKTEAPPPRWPGEPAELPQPPAAGANRWLPPVGETFKDWVELFGKNAADLNAAFHLVSSSDEMRQILVQLRDAEGWKRAACHSGMLPDAICPVLGMPMLKTDKTYEVHELEKCDVGFTECDALIAQTGSVVVTSRSAGGRALSILPPHHVVLARRDQLVPDLPAAFELLKTEYGSDYPSMISFITGPSRTGDIERILVLGAHGPKKLTVLCV
ncbi:MAG: LutC/YkgG family protein [Limisphaerales bacterium]